MFKRIYISMLMALSLMAFSCTGTGKTNPEEDKPGIEDTDQPGDNNGENGENGDNNGGNNGDNNGDNNGGNNGDNGDNGTVDPPAPEPQYDTVKLRVMQFNILQSKDEAEGHTWSQYRATPCKEMFKATDPDIICLQECRRTQLDFMKNNFSGYDYFLYAKDGVKKAGYENMMSCTDDSIFKNGGHRDVIAVRKGRYELLSWGKYWFSDTPDVSSYAGKYEGGGTPKLSLWVKLKDKEKDYILFIWCTHFFPHGDIPTRKLCSTMSVERMKQLVGEEDVVFFCGDLNLSYESEALAPLNEYMKNARIEAETTDQHPTYTGFRTDASTWTLIDHIYYRNAKPLTYKVVSEPIENGTSVLSDHFPLYTDFQIILQKDKQ